MKTFSDRCLEELYININEENISEGFFDWLKSLFKRAIKSQSAIKKRYGKLPDFKIKDTKDLQASKVVKGKLEKAEVDDLIDLGFELLKTMFMKKKDYFYDKDNKEIKSETITYVYTPEEPLSKDEKYIMIVGIKAPKEITFIDGYTHIIDFEPSIEFDINDALLNDVFKTYIDNTIKKENNQIKGITIKYVNAENDYEHIQYNGKKFEIADEEKKLMKMDF